MEIKHLDGDLGQGGGVVSGWETLQNLENPPATGIVSPPALPLTWPEQ